MNPATFRVVGKIALKWLVAVAWLVGVALVVGGCSSLKGSTYVSPRVTGRVMDGTTHQPLSGVQVRRLTSDSSSTSADVPPGGRLMQNNELVLTGRDGAFVVPSVRTLGPLGGSGWYSVTISFNRSGYATLVKSYTLKNSTNTPSGEPLVEAGEIEMNK